MLRRMFRRALLLLALAAVLVAPASADTVRHKRIKSPNGQISCYAVKVGSGIECFAPYIEEIGELDTYIALKKRGKARFGERGDYPGYEADQHTLRHGDTWVWRGVRCSMRRSGMTCRNADDHGFRLAKGDVRRF